MSIEHNYLELNKESWNQKTDYHIASDFYNMEHFLQGNTSLNDIELNLLGDIKGKKVLHLQCHFGQDSISLARMGAEVTGVDFSDKAITFANELAHKTKANARFICCDIYSLPAELKGQFDLVYTSYGTIGWLPDIDKWAQVVSHFTKPGGKFVFVEFHPVVWMFDNDFQKIEYRYFKSDAIIETESGTYAERTAPITTKTVGWNHGLAEVVNALIQNGLQINRFNEYDYSPHACFNCIEEFEPKKFRIKQLENKIPMVYSIVATKSV